MSADNLMERLGWTEQQKRSHLAQRQALSAQAAEQHRRKVAEAVESFAKLKFARTYCSKCGNEFGAGNEGYSACSQHRTA